MAQVLQGSEPNEHGTWQYGRGGWCDGQEVGFAFQEPLVLGPLSCIRPADKTFVSTSKHMNQPSQGLCLLWLL